MMYDVFKFNYYNLIQYGATMFDANDWVISACVLYDFTITSY